MKTTTVKVRYVHSVLHLKLTPLILAALRAKIGTLSLDKQKKLEEDVAKAEKKAEKKADAALKKQQVGLLISAI